MESGPGEGLGGEVLAHIQQGSFALCCVRNPQILVSSAVIQGSYPELPCRLCPQPGGLQPPSAWLQPPGTALSLP